MKRSTAPSTLFQKNKKLKGEENNEEEEGKKKVKKTKNEKEVKINHLLQWSLQPIIQSSSIGLEDENSNLGDGLEDGEGEPSGPGKNIPLFEKSKPIYYAVSIKLANTKTINGLLRVSFADLTLFDDEGKQIGNTLISREDDDDGNHIVKIKKKSIYIQERYSFPIGNKRAKILAVVTQTEFESGTFFMQDIEANLKKKAADAKKQNPTIRLAAAKLSKKGGFSVPYKGLDKGETRLQKALHSPNAPGALVLFDPKDVMGENKIPVVVDPVLCATLRPHQREGIQFLFDCVCMGIFDPVTKRRYNGCILADEMGLGKSIQAISLIWTALKQGPTGEPCARKAVVVCPSSLVGNWCNEISKWLGDELKPLPLGESSKKTMGKLSEFQFGDHDVLVISYDQLKILQNDIAKIWNIDLVICDEGHRLKNKEIKTSQAVKMMKTKKRVILSGTPIQNDLMELYAMVDYVNPGILGTEKQFKKVFEEPILASREKEATDEEKEIGRYRSQELTAKTEKFILRRTAVTNSKYLPPKIDYLIFCKLSKTQEQMYSSMCKVYSEKIGTKIDALPLLTALKKLCNTPELLHIMSQKNEESFPYISEYFPQGYSDGVFSTEFSGKLLFTDKLLHNIRANTKGDKIVIVSNYTETLAVLARLCKERGYGYFQLDGSTVVKKRQVLVDQFNVPSGKEFVFLLSSKAGGCGLNLVGANHLMLFDPDWNPANDEQAMARVWRPGQLKKVYLYRTLSTGTLEEKVYQRQVTKLALSKAVVKGAAEKKDVYVEEKPSFTTNELRDIFKYRNETNCDTHDLLNCRCSLGATKILQHKRKGLSMDDLNSWKHCDTMSTLDNPILKDAADGICSFIMSKETDTAKEVTEEIEEEEEVLPIEHTDEKDEKEVETAPKVPKKSSKVSPKSKRPTQMEEDDEDEEDDGGPDSESEDEDFGDE